ncbi:MerR family transcriptional regulator [Paenibacillus assamensis]|uniref:MerR family transcriptional regulator n=1 Tax=Paenibacillus assamensis TaxID=311244 RepID=UPI0003FF4568|nr:MerR family transcriptional regulator [Paenibacillus assamensis]
MKIQDVSRMLGISTRSIRYYEERGLLAPIQKEDNGYRTFRVEDIERLRLISWLRELGLSIEEIRNCLDKALAGDMAAIRIHMMRRRKSFVEEIVQLKLLVQQMDQLIHISEDTEGEIFFMTLEQAAEQAKRIDAMRNAWEDRWNFDSQADHYDEKVSNVGDDAYHVHADYKKALERACEEARIEPGNKGLDLGIGTGNLSARCAENGAIMTGIDQSEQMLNRCREKWPAFRLLLGNMMALPVVNETFDFVVSTYALHHLTDEQKLIALQEIDQVLVPGGRVAISDVMFENEAHRESYYTMLKQVGREDEIRWIEDEYYADRSKLLDWWRANGYETGAEQLGELVHLVYATKSI